MQAAVAPFAGPGTDAGPEARHELRSELAVGLRFLIREPVLRTLVLCRGTYNLFFVMVESLLIAYATRTLHLSASVTGLVLAVAAIGFPVGTLIAGWLTRRLGAGQACFNIPYLSLRQAATPALPILLASPALRARGPAKGSSSSRL